MLLHCMMTAGYCDFQMLLQVNAVVTIDTDTVVLHGSHYSHIMHDHYQILASTLQGLRQAGPS
jgi:hypothetical protein